MLTITRALAEIKLLDKRIGNAIHNLYPVNVGVTKLVNPAMAAKCEEFKLKVASDYQSVNDLIDRRAAIKAAVVVSNATTLVNIGGKEYTVAAAIETKTSIANRKALLRQLKHQFSKVTNELESATNSYNQRLDTFLSSQANALGKSKTDSEWVAAQSAVFSEMHQPVLIDPLNIAKVIDELETAIDKFESEVDYCLSENNARTTIEV